MPDFAPNYTHRIRIRYSAFGAIHSQSWRAPSNDGAVELNDVFEKIQLYYDALATLLTDDLALISISEANADSDVFLPSAYTLTLSGSADYSGVGRSKKAAITSFVGRSILGHRAIVYQFGIANDVNDVASVGEDFRVTGVEQPLYQDAIDALNSSIYIVANDDAAVVWYPYVNVGYNDYWKRRVRAGA